MAVKLNLSKQGYYFSSLRRGMSHEVLYYVKRKDTMLIMSGTAQDTLQYGLHTWSITSNKRVITGLKYDYDPVWLLVSAWYYDTI